MKSLITSTQNPTIKNLLLLREKARERKKQQLFLVEGIREIRLAIEAGYAMSLLIYCPEIFENQFDSQHSGSIHSKTSIPITNDASLVFPVPVGDQTELLEVSRNVFNRIALRQDDGGILACAIPQPNSLEDLKLPDNPFLLVLESVEKPGNLGAMLRTADAAGIDAVIVCNPGTDLYNPNTIRSSLGSFFTNQIALASSETCIKWLHQQKKNAFGAALSGNTFYTDADYTIPSAIIMGSEAWGLSEQWIKACDRLIKIPMLGKVDSLNVSTSAAILLFEGVRQRMDLSS